MPTGSQPQSHQNILLQQMADGDRRRLIDAAEPVLCRRGHALFEADEEVNSLYFPVTTILSIEEAMEGRARIGVAVVGRDGFIGWSPLLGSDRTTHRVVVQCADGMALKVEREAVAAACRASGALHRLLLQFVHVVMAQIGRTAASQIEHAIDRRIAAWILMRHDRGDDDEIAVRHDEIADGLNSRRASVTDALHRLEGEQLIRCRRERVGVRDRAGLEAFAGEAYGASEALYRRLIAPFGKSAADQPALTSMSAG